MNSYNLAWIIISVLLLISFVVILWLYVRCLSTRMLNTECLSLLSDFAVTINTDADSTQELTVTSLNDAFNVCNQNVCTSFSYNESQNLMKILSINSPTSPSDSSNIFIRQVNTF